MNILIVDDQEIKVIDPGTCIIIISAMDHKGTIEECKSLGALDYFIKPLDNIRLINVLNQIEKSKASDDSGHY